MNIEFWIIAASLGVGAFLAALFYGIITRFGKREGEGFQTSKLSKEATSIIAVLIVIVFGFITFLALVLYAPKEKNAFEEQSKLERQEPDTRQRSNVHIRNARILGANGKIYPVSPQTCTPEKPCKGEDLVRGVKLHVELNREGFAAAYLQDQHGNFFNQEGRLFIRRLNVGSTKLWPGIPERIDHRDFNLWIITSDKEIPTFPDSTPLRELPSPSKGYKWGPIYLLFRNANNVSPSRPQPSTLNRSFQNFEPNNGTPGSGKIEKYCRHIWFSSCDFEFSNVHRGNRSLRIEVQKHLKPSETGGTVRIFPSSRVPVDLFTARSISVWVYDTQGNNTVELKLCNNDECPDSVWSASRSTKNSWEQITWTLSSFNKVDKRNITGLEIYEWNSGVYYFDDIEWQ